MANEKQTADKKPGGIVADYFSEQGAKSRKQRSEGGDDVKVSLVNMTNVRFTEDFGEHIKKGHEQQVSDVALAIYEKAGVIEKI